MLLEIAKVLITVLTPLALKFLINLIRQSSRSHLKLQEDYKFISSFLSIDIRARQPLIVEQAFYVFFRKRYSFEAIKLLIRFPNPTKAFRLFNLAGEVVHIENGWIATTKSESTLQKLFIVKCVAYFILIMIAVLPIVYAPLIIDHYGSTTLIQILISGFVAGAVGVEQLFDVASIRASRDLMKKQKTLAG